MTRSMSSRCAALGAFGTLLCLGSPTLAQDPAVLNKVTDLNKQAVEAYDNLDMEEAAKLLRQALEICAAEGLNKHKVKARTHLNLGVVLVGGLKQRDLGMRQFKRALEIDPAAKPIKTVMNPEIQAAFDDALKDAGGVGAETTPPQIEATSETIKPAPPEEAQSAEGGRPPKRFKGILHAPITEAEPNATILIKAAVEPGLGVDKVVLAYRSEGATDFLAREMDKDEAGWYMARIPQPATAGNIISYYIEARNKAGGPLAANGSEAEPHVISLVAPQAAPETGEDVGVAGQSDQGEGGEPFDRSKRWFFMSIGVGAGGGYISGKPEVNPNDNMGRALKFTGFAPAMLLHLSPEIGFFYTSDVIISLQGRLQVVSGATQVRHPTCPGVKDAKGNGLCEPATGALAVLGKITWLFGQPKSFRPFAAVAVGGGEIRHLISINSLTDCGPNGGLRCEDTLVGGPFLFGPSAGFTYRLSQALDFVAGVNALIGVPKTIVNLDLNLGFSLGL